MICKVISGGQTGVDRGALDAAMVCGLLTGGWCPRGRRAEDGIIPGRYTLQEADSVDYDRRTRLNVEAAGGTLILCRNPALMGGTQLTWDWAGRAGKPVQIFVLPATGPPDEPGDLRAWLTGLHDTVNIAGPRESQEPGIQSQVRELLIPVFQAMSPSQ